MDVLAIAAVVILASVVFGLGVHHGYWKAYYQHLLRRTGKDDGNDI